MREIPVFKDTRLLEALDYIDRDLIAEVINDIKAPDADAVPGQSKKAVWRSVKQVLMLAACVVLISAFIPMVSYVIERYDISLGGIFGHSTTEETTVDTPTEHAENPSYPIFTPDLEPISDEMIAELKEVWYQKVYAAEYAAYSKYYASRSDLTDQQKENSSIIIAQDHASFFTSILFSTKKEDHFQGRYYGTISDCVIFAINTYLEDEYNVITIGKTSIINDYSFHIFAYKDGIVKAIETAYSDGWLNADDAEKIRERHNKFNAYGYWKVDEQKEYTYAKFVTDLEEISDKKIEQINNALFKKNYEQEMLNLEKDSDTPEILNERRAKELYARKAYTLAKAQSNMFVVGIKTMDHFINSFRYYGTFGSCVIWASVNNYPPQETVYDLDWVQLTYSAETHVNVYSNGKIYDLKEAFDQGILDIDNARKLYHRYLTYEAYLISDRTAPILAFPEDAPAAEIYEEAKAGNFVVFNDAFVTAGEDIWNSFYEQCSSGLPAEVHIVNYYPSRSAIFLTTVLYNGVHFEQYTEARSGGYTNLLYSKYKHIIKYDGEPLDPESAIHRREEVYILVNDETLTYPKIKESTESLNYYIAFTKLSDIKDEYTTLIPRE